MNKKQSIEKRLEEKFLGTPLPPPAFGDTLETYLLKILALIEYLEAKTP